MFSEILKNNCSSGYVWCLGKAVNPVITLERATEKRRRAGPLAVLVISGLLVTLLHQGRAFRGNLGGSRQRRGAVAHPWQVREGLTHVGYRLVTCPELCGSKKCKVWNLALEKWPRGCIEMHSTAEIVGKSLLQINHSGMRPASG